jgi:RNA polymerase sigma-70 factor (ECF subfamily)
LVDRFAQQVQRLDLRRVKRLAATLVRNTEREVVVSRVREMTRAGKSVPISPVLEIAAEPQVEAEPSPFGIGQDRSPADEVASLGSWLARTIGHDADLVVQVVIHERNRSELAEMLGISVKTLHKRIERALARARRALDVDSLSPGGGDLAFACHDDKTRRPSLLDVRGIHSSARTLQTLGV